MPAKGKYLSFHRARDVVRKLGLRTVKEWKQWSKSGARPNNIPADPYTVYRDAGWISWPGWLGYEPRRQPGGQHAGVSFLPFNRARAAVRKLGLRTQQEWRQWSKSGARPNNIPSAPEQAYRDAGWISYPDWLGYEPRQGGQQAGVSFLSFNRARTAVRKRGLRNEKEWKQWSKSGARPNNIPGSPERVYRDAGWISMPDWLGYEPRQGGHQAGVSFLPFNRARAAVRKLGLRRQEEWHQWSKSGARPNNIPGHPDKVYRDAGWISWPDWLGYEPRQGGQNAGVSFLPFNRARAAVRKLGLRSTKEWQQWSKSGARPNNIPSNPRQVYCDAGWISYPDWLGYEPRQGGQNAGVTFLPFNTARAAVRKLGLRSRKEWNQWSKSGARPNNIPSTPYKVYRDAGWISYPDWLGYEPRNGGQHAGVSFLPFNRARAAVRKLGLRSIKEWQQWSKSGARPNNIPSGPQRAYHDAGWISMPDWLGYERTTRNPSTRGTKRKRKRTAAAAASSSSSTPAPPSPQPAAEAAEAEAPPSDDDDYDNDCPVCFEPIPDAERVRLRCSHWFCAACVRDVAKTAAATAQEEGGGDGLGRVSRQGVMVSCPMCRARVRVAMAAV